MKDNAQSVENPVLPPKPRPAHIDDHAAEIIPPQLRDLDRWVAWAWKWNQGKQKWDKPPVDPETTREIDQTNPENWLRFDVAREIATKRCSGIGIALGSKEQLTGLVGIDIDNCIDDRGVVHPTAMAIVDRFNSYTEVSPSGRGLRIWIRGKKPGTKCRNSKHHDEVLAGVEVYEADRYLTVTGRHLEGTPTAIAARKESLDGLYVELFGGQANGHVNGRRPSGNPVDVSDEALIEKARRGKNGDRFTALFDHGDAGRYGGDESSADMALMNDLAFWFGRDPYRMERVFSSSALGQRGKWKDREDYRQRTIAEAIDKCHEVYSPGAKPSSNGTGHQPESQVEVNEAIDDPHRLGRMYRDGECRHPDGLMLRFHRDTFLRWDGSAYRTTQPAELNARLNVVIKQEFDRANIEAIRKWKERGGVDDRGKECPMPQAKKVSNQLIGNVSGALAGMTLVGGENEFPSWLCEDPPFPAEGVLPTRNALVSLPNLVDGNPAIVPTTPMFFGSYALPFDFDLDAPKPATWLAFLDSIWGHDPQSIQTLQDWFGYCLIEDTRQQKILGLIGPKRAGKDTIARTLRALVGVENTAGPTLSGLVGNFGLAPLIGKPLAIISDARLSGRTDQAIILERLLAISGEGTLTVDRKHQSSWTGKLPTRIVLVSNELPRLNDASGAMPGRFIFLRLTKSFFGKEDKTLFDRICMELPGILLWSIQGWKRLKEQGSFVQPDSATQLMEDMENLSSPYAAFVRDRCEVRPGLETPVQNLYQEWRSWCSSVGREKPGDEQNFGRGLGAACSGLGRGQRRTNEGVIRVYVGIGLKDSF